MQTHPGSIAAFWSKQGHQTSNVMGFHTIEVTALVPVNFMKFRRYAENLGMAPHTILEKWLELPVWDSMEEEPEDRPDIRELRVYSGLGNWANHTGGGGGGGSRAPPRRQSSLCSWLEWSNS